MTLENSNYALLYPTLIVGLGGTGARTTRLVKRMVERYYRARGCAVPPIIRYLVIDTEDLRNLPGEEPLSADEYVNLGSDFDANRVIEFMEQTEGLYESVREWWTSTGHDTGRIRVKNGAGQMRDVGRLALFVGYQHLLDRMKATLAQIQSVASLQASQQILDRIGVRPDTSPQVWMVGSLCGGTGAGIFLDVAYMLRDLLQTHSTFLPNGIFVMPQAFMQALTGKVDLQRRIQANAYAALLEITELMNSADRGKFEFYPDQQTRVALETVFTQSGRGGEEPRTPALPSRYARETEPRHDARGRIRPPSVPFDRIFLVDQENEKSVSWASMDSVTDMVAQALLTNIVYRQQIEWEERNIYFTETYPGIPNGWRHFNSIGASSVVLLHGGEQDYYTRALRRRLCDLLLDGRSGETAGAPARVDEIVEAVGGDRLLAALMPDDLARRLAGSRPHAAGADELERAERLAEYLRAEIRLVRQHAIEAIEQACPGDGARLRADLDVAIEQRAWEICRLRGVDPAREWVAQVAQALERAGAELRQGAAEDGVHGRAAEREMGLSDDALAQIGARAAALRRIGAIKGSLFEHPLRAIEWVWARVRGRGTDLDRLHAEADRRMRLEFESRARQVVSREAAEVVTGLLGSRGQQRDRAVITRLETLLASRRAEIELAARAIDAEIEEIRRRLQGRRGQTIADGHVVNDVPDATDEIARDAVVRDLADLMRTDFTDAIRRRLLEVFGATYSWQAADLNDELAARAVEVYSAWLARTTERYGQDGILLEPADVRMKIAQSRALLNYTREARASDLCPHLRRVFVSDAAAFLRRHGPTLGEESFVPADAYSTRNPLRVDIYQAVYGLPASLLTHVEEYGRVYDELFAKAEDGQACPLHVHRSWNTRPSRPAAGILA